MRRFYSTSMDFPDYVSSQGVFSRREPPDTQRRRPYEEQLVAAPVVYDLSQDYTVISDNPLTTA